MTAKKDPPFRAEHIGSLLRPPELLAARRAFDEGKLSAEALRAEEDRWIKQAVALQEAVGLRSITEPLLCDAKLREGFKARGYDPDTMLGKYKADLNKVSVRIDAVEVHFLQTDAEPLGLLLQN
ncbi:MAG: hypothetical protein HYZ72_01615 [Deltaproteobacteria bacterium]|nr:hypothetical protein [Deltaproteobacteria bacterium]